MKIVVNIAEQRLDLLDEEDKSLRAWPVSTATNGPGEESGSGEYVTVQYVFQSPADPDVRVVLVDNLTKFTDRAAEYPDIIDLIPTIVATFEFAR